MKRSCCVECHFKAELEYLGPSLPPHALRWLRLEHRRLVMAGMPSEQVSEHAAAEETVLAPHLTLEQYAWLRRDHAHLGAR